MCPDSSCTINTAMPFKQSVYFGTSNIHVTLTQNGQSFDFDACNDGNYVSNMQQAFNYGKLWKGFHICATRAVIVNATNFYVYESLMKYLN